jgi:ABC-type nickel/cobalt efflux system permease component RcnA
MTRGWAMMALVSLAVIVLLTIAVSSGHLPAPATAWNALLLEIQEIQRGLHRQLADAIRAVKAQGPAAAWTLVGLSFLYGVFHAAGPGHGKFVISTYLVTQESRLKRGLLLSGLSSLAQGVTAIVAVEATVGLLDLSMRDAKSTATTLEASSYALVALVGLVLAISAGRRLLARRSHTQSHDDGAHCGHAHGPSAHDLRSTGSLRQSVAIILSVGLRPCSGAILVLLFAQVLDLPWSGIAAVLAMSLGTALTISALACLAVYGRKASLKLTDALPASSRRLGALVDTVALGGGLVVIALGLSLLRDTLSVTQHPLM